MPKAPPREGPIRWTFNTFNSNVDTDTDPFNPMILEPEEPFAQLQYSENRNAQAIMSNDRSRPGPFLYYTELQYDDRGGRDALYPSLRVCTCDCSGDGRVTRSELLTAIDAALGRTPLPYCHRADRDYDGRVSVDELLAGANDPTDACSPAP